MNDENPVITPLLTVKDVMAILKISQTKAYALRWDIGFIKIGGAVRFKREDVEQFIEEGMAVKPRAKKPYPRLRKGTVDLLAKFM